MVVAVDDEEGLQEVANSGQADVQCVEVRFRWKREGREKVRKEGFISKVQDNVVEAEGEEDAEKAVSG